MRLLTLVAATTNKIWKTKKTSSSLNMKEHNTMTIQCQDDGNTLRTHKKRTVVLYSCGVGLKRRTGDVTRILHWPVFSITDFAFWNMQKLRPRKKTRSVSVAPGPGPIGSSLQKKSLSNRYGEYLSGALIVPVLRIVTK